jgi:hypothetical protein
MRIAVSVACAIACVLLIVLWAMTDRYLVVLEKLTASRVFQMRSENGRIALWQIKPPRFLMNYSFGRPVSVHGPIRDVADELDRAGTLGFGYLSAGMTTIVWAPHWAFALLAGLLAFAPWIKWSLKFSLRTLLIVMTLAAVVLGLIVTFR